MLDIILYIYNIMGLLRALITTGLAFFLASLFFTKNAFMKKIPMADRLIKYFEDRKPYLVIIIMNLIMLLW